MADRGPGEIRRGGGRFSEMLTCGMKIGREVAMSRRDAPCSSGGRDMRRSRMGG